MLRGPPRGGVISVHPSFCTSVYPSVSPATCLSIRPVFPTVFVSFFFSYFCSVLFIFLYCSFEISVFFSTFLNIFLSSFVCPPSVLYLFMTCSKDVMDRVSVQSELQLISSFLSLFLSFKATHFLSLKPVVVWRRSPRTQNVLATFPTRMWSNAHRAAACSAPFNTTCVSVVESNPSPTTPSPRRCTSVTGLIRIKSGCQKNKKGTNKI